MKHIFKTGAILLCISIAINANAQTKSLENEKPNTHWCLLWGIIKSENYPEKTGRITVLATPVIVKTAIKTDGTNQEMKSVLWGAVQWTRKKEVQPSKKGSNE